MSHGLQLLAALADAKFHPPADLTAQLDLSEEELAQALTHLKASGLKIDQQCQRGYRLVEAIDPLSIARIQSAMETRSNKLLGTLAVYLQTDSTNSELRRMLRNGAPPGSACLSESQSAGRGRRGRRWIAPTGNNLMLSVSWRYPSGSDLSGLSPALGVAASRALEDSGIRNTQLKWPNDLVWQDRKFGGILVELFPGPNQQQSVIAGLGINVHLQPQQGTDIDQPWTDLHQISGSRVARNPLAGRLLHHLLLTLENFHDSDYSHWQQSYHQRDALIGRIVTLTHPDGSRHEGIARGIDASGALRMEQHGRISSHPIGEASARARIQGNMGAGH